MPSPTLDSANSLRLLRVTSAERLPLVPETELRQHSLPELELYLKALTDYLRRLATKATIDTIEATVKSVAPSSGSYRTLDKWIRVTANGTTYLSVDDWRGILFFCMGSLALSDPESANWTYYGSVLNVYHFGHAWNPGTDELLTSTSAIGSTLQIYIESGTGKIKAVASSYTSPGDFRLTLLAVAQKTVSDVTI